MCSLRPLFGLAFDIEGEQAGQYLNAYCIGSAVAPGEFLAGLHGAVGPRLGLDGAGVLSALEMGTPPPIRSCSSLGSWSTSSVSWSSSHAIRTTVSPCGGSAGSTRSAGKRWLRLGSTLSVSGRRPGDAGAACTLTSASC